MIGHDARLPSLSSILIDIPKYSTSEAIPRRVDCSSSNGPRTNSLLLISSCLYIQAIVARQVLHCTYDGQRDFRSLLLARSYHAYTMMVYPSFLQILHASGGNVPPGEILLQPSSSLLCCLLAIRRYQPCSKPPLPRRFGLFVAPLTFFSVLFLLSLPDYDDEGKKVGEDRGRG